MYIILFAIFVSKMFVMLESGLTYVLLNLGMLEKLIMKFQADQLT